MIEEIFKGPYSPESGNHVYTENTIANWLRIFRYANRTIRILAVIILECTIFESTCFIFRKTKIQLKFEKKHDKLNMKGLQSGDTCPLKVSVSGQEGKLWSIWKAISQFIVN
jgi:hypothetical protein